MKSRSSLPCILGFVIFVARASLFADLETHISESPVSIYEVQEYTANIADTITHVAESILCILPEQHTFENTLRPWNQLCMLLSQNIHTLNSIAKSDLISNTTASQALADLHVFLFQTLNFYNLPQLLTTCAQKILESDLSTPLQRHMATRFINNNWQASLGLHLSKENINPEECVILDLDCNNPIEMSESNITYISKLFIEEESLLQKDSQQGIVNRHFASVLDSFNILPIRSRRDRDEDKGGRSCEGGIKGKWGDGSGIHWEGYVKGEAHDGKGNYVEGKITQKNDGLSEVDVYGGHEDKKK